MSNLGGDGHLGVLKFHPFLWPKIKGKTAVKLNPVILGSVATQTVFLYFYPELWGRFPI